MLTIIQGDTFEADIEIEGIIYDTVANVVLSCKKLNFNHTATWQESGYYILIPKEKTTEFPSGLYSYDITITFLSGETITAKRNGILEVLRKVNSG